jgi:ABC-type lipoprotein export system ATPase subunit
MNSSGWNKWDFHVHTPCSILHNDFGDPNLIETWDQYISNLESLSDQYQIRAIGITDYFIVDGYKRVLEYKSKGRLNNVWIFPNIEFRLDLCIKEKRVNFHVLFSPDVSINSIEENFLHDLDFIYQSDPYKTAEKRKLKRSNIIAFGEKLQKEHGKFCEKSAFFTGCMNAVVDLTDIQEKLKRFHGDYLLVLPDENLSDLDWDGQDHALRKQLIQSAHAIFSSNKKSKEFYLGKKHESVDHFIKEFHSIKPCIWGSDTHGYNDGFLKPDNDNFCWIKSQITWRGLKQILFEPETRVMIQATTPEAIKSIYTIQSIELKESQVNESLKFHPFASDISSNLVTIIGGRGSGKTAVLDIIASCFKEGEKLSEIKNSFFNRLYNHSNNNSPIETIIEFASSDIFCKKVGVDEEIFEKSNILYLTQDHFEEYSANPSKLNSHIIALIFDRFSDEKRKYDGERNNLFKLMSEINNINLEIEQLQNEVEQNREKTEILLKKQEGEFTDIAKRITTLENRQGQKRVEQDILTQSQKQLRIKRRTLDFIVQTTNDAILKTDEFLTNYCLFCESINNNLRNYDDSIKHLLLPEDLAELRSIKTNMEKILLKLESDEPKLDEQIQKSVERIGALDGINKDLADLSVKKDELEESIQESKDYLLYLGETTRKALDLDERRFRIFHEYIARIIAMKSFLQSIIDKFEIDKHELLQNLSFSSKVHTYQFQEYFDRILEKIDNRTHNEKQLTGIFDKIREEFVNLLNNESSSNMIDKSLNNLRDKTSELKWKKSTTSSEFYNTVFSPFFDIGLEIRFNDKTLENLSMGERAIVLLKILLSLDDKPLLIDQPEEHLDNKYIFTELVPAFRQSKNKRQVIIATHNANLVVNTDAEQVIIADITQGEISYRVGPLEDEELCKTIKSLLEGGDEAFRKREEKYGLIF